MDNGGIVDDVIEGAADLTDAAGDMVADVVGTSRRKGRFLLLLIIIAVVVVVMKKKQEEENQDG